MRIVLLSSTAFGAHCARNAILGQAGLDLVGVLTTGRKIDISYAPKGVEIVTHADLRGLAEDAGAELVELASPVRSLDCQAHLKRLKPDLLLVLGWYFNIPLSVRQMAPRGCVGIHASLLPRFRGGAPIPWAIIQGETETGVTLFHMVDEVDAGDIIGQQGFPIQEQDTCATVYEKATQASISLLEQFLPRLADGTAPRMPQDHSQATHFPQRTPADGRIDWSWSPRRIRDFIRAQTRPYPGAFTVIEGKRVTIWDADVCEASEAPQDEGA